MTILPLPKFRFDGHPSGCEFHLTIDRTTATSRMLRLSVSGTRHDKVGASTFVSGTTVTLATPEFDLTQLIDQIVERIQHLIPEAMSPECFHSLTDALTRWLSEIA